MPRVTLQQVKNGKKMGRRVRSGRELSHTRTAAEATLWPLPEFLEGLITRVTRPLTPDAPGHRQKHYSGNNGHLASVFWAPQFEQRRNKSHPDPLSADGGRAIQHQLASSSISQMATPWPHGGHLPSKASPLLPGGRPAMASRPRCLVLHCKHSRPKAVSCQPHGGNKPTILELTVISDLLSS